MCRVQHEYDCIYAAVSYQGKTNTYFTLAGNGNCGWSFDSNPLSMSFYPYSLSINVRGVFHVGAAHPGLTWCLPLMQPVTGDMAVGDVHNNHIAVITGLTST